MLTAVIISIVVFVDITSLNAQVNTERMRIGSDHKGLSGFFDINLRVKSGNVEIFDTGSGLRLGYSGNRFMTFIVSNIQYATKKSKTFINRGFTHIRYNRNFHPRCTFEVFTQYEFNEFIRLLSRTLVGTGARIPLLKRDQFTLFYGSTYMHEWEHLNVRAGSGDIAKSSINRWSNYLVTNWQSKHDAAFVNTVYIQPRFDDFNDIRILNEMALQAKVSSWLSITLTFNLRFDSKPPSGVKKTDIELKNSLRLSF